MTSMPCAGLQGHRILLIENKYNNAAEIAPTLLNAGAETIGPAVTVADAEGLIATEGRIYGGLPDVNLGGKPVWPVVDIQRAQEVPMLLAMGYNSGHPEGSCASPFLRETSP